MQKPSDKIMSLIISFELYKSKINYYIFPLAVLVSFLCIKFVFDQDAVGIILSILAGFLAGIWTKKIVTNVKYSTLVYKLYGKDQKAFFDDASYAKEYFNHQANKLDPDGSNLDQIVNEILDDKGQVSADAPAKVGAVELTIVNMPEKPIGSYLDTKIYEWLDIATGVPGETVRFEFHRTVDNLKHYQIEPDCILLHPGIVYRLSRISGE